MKKVLLFLLALFLGFGVSGAKATEFNLTAGKGTTIGPSASTQGAIFVEFDDAMQETVSSGTGVIDPFLTIKGEPKDWEHGFSTDAYPVLDTHRDVWNHAIQLRDLYQSAYNPDYPGYFEFLLDINQNGSELITQHELQVWMVPEANGGAIDYLGSNGMGGLFDTTTGNTLVWDLDAGPDGDCSILMDYSIWSGSGQNFDVGFYLPFDTFDGWSMDDYVYLYAYFGMLGGVGSPSNDGFEEYALRGNPVPEPATMFLFGAGLAGLVGFRRKFKK